MQIIHTDLKQGDVKLKVENLDDLWYLESVLSLGDRIKSRTIRTVKPKSGSTKDTKGEKVPMTLEINLEEKLFDRYVDLLRLRGKIVSGPEDIISFGSYHTFELSPNDILTVHKEKWQKWQAERLEDAVKETKKASLLIVSMEEGEADLGVLRKFGLDYISFGSEIVGKAAGEGQREKLKGEFYSVLEKQIADVLGKENIQHVILAGPGFAKENFLDYLKEHDKAMAKRCLLESTGNSGRPGIQEVLKRGAAERILNDMRVVQETKMVEDWLAELGKDSGLAVYANDAEEALESGAADYVLISDKFMRENPDRMQHVMNSADKTRANHMIVSTEHEAGKKLQSFSGLAVKLRYRI